MTAEVWWGIELPMRNLPTLLRIVSVMLLIGLAGPTGCGRSTSEAPRTGAAGAVGKVVAVNPDLNTVTIAPPSPGGKRAEPVACQVTENTRILKGAGAGTLGDAMVGQYVTYAFKPARDGRGKPELDWIRFGPPPKGAKAAP